MQSVLVTIAICSISMSIVALLYMLVTSFLNKIYLAKWQYYAWLVIVLGFIIPVRPYYDWSALPIPLPSIEADFAAAPLSSDKPLADAVAMDQVTLNAWDIPWLTIIGSVWLAGIGFVLGYHLLKHQRFMRMVRRWSEEVEDRQVLLMLDGIRRKMGVRRPAKLLQCPFVSTPMVVGFTSPTILLPVVNFNKDELDFILRHELVHYTRRDAWYKGLVLVAVSIHWFNPIVYLMSRAISLQCELSCDETVLSNSDGYTRQQYSETIIGVIRYQANTRTALSSSFYGGIKGLRKRVVSIMDTTHKRSGVIMLLSVLVLSIGTGTAVASSVSPEEKLPVKEIAITSDAAVSNESREEKPAHTEGEVYKWLQYDEDQHIYRYLGRWVRTIDDRYTWKGQHYGGISQTTAGDSNQWGEPIDIRTVRNSETNQIEQLVELTEEEMATIHSLLHSSDR